VVLCLLIVVDFVCILLFESFDLFRVVLDGLGDVLLLMLYDLVFVCAVDAL